MEIILAVLLTLIMSISFFIIRNLIQKNEKLDDILTNYEKFISKQSEAIESCNERLKQIDDKGIFKSDDEIGWFFKEIQKIQEALNEFTLK
jgi:predicted PurR-regulated permease PerM